MRTPRPHVRRAIVSAAAIALLACAGLAARAESYWYENYERAVALVDDGRFEEASPLLSALIQQNPVPELGVRVAGDRAIDYLPQLQQARIQLAQGDLEGASRNLDVCEAFCAIRKGSRVERDIRRLREQIDTKTGPDATQAELARHTSR